MAEVDAQRVIDKLGVRLANAEVQRAIAESQLEDMAGRLEQAHREIAELRAAALEMSPTDAPDKAK
ncbi:hypothetical protein SEA_BRUHMOMENT_41 [Arthrobacter phage BruhMoment]|nr:hypothetical protein SEA_BRUHMOMENT_41 [Arthrobacter phage BruhMoment]